MCAGAGLDYTVAHYGIITSSPRLDAVLTFVDDATPDAADNWAVGEVRHSLQRRGAVAAVVSFKLHWRGCGSCVDCVRVCADISLQLGSILSKSAGHSCLMTVHIVSGVRWCVAEGLSHVRIHQGHHYDVLCNGVLCAGWGF